MRLHLCQPNPHLSTGARMVYTAAYQWSSSHLLGKAPSSLSSNLHAVLAKLHSPTYCSSKLTVITTVLCTFIRGLLALWQYMSTELGLNTDAIWDSIKDLVIKTIIWLVVHSLNNMIMHSFFDWVSSTYYVCITCSSESHCSSLIKAYLQNR